MNLIRISYHSDNKEVQRDIAAWFKNIGNPLLRRLKSNENIAKELEDLKEYEYGI